LFIYTYTHNFLGIHLLLRTTFYILAKTCNICSSEPLKAWTWKKHNFILHIPEYYCILYIYHTFKFIHCLHGIRFVSKLGYCEQCCNKRMCASRPTFWLTFPWIYAYKWDQYVTFFSFLKKFHTALRRLCTNIHSQQPWKMVPFSPHRNKFMLFFLLLVTANLLGMC
jgi:hypothetical protein